MVRRNVQIMCLHLVILVKLFTGIILFLVLLPVAVGAAGLIICIVIIICGAICMRRFVGIKQGKPISNQFYCDLTAGISTNDALLSL